MIKPVNGHLLIEPVKQESFIAQSREVFEEIGVILDGDFNNFAYGDGNGGIVTPFKIGDRVYFDAWLAAKFPKGTDGKEFYWLVKWEDVRAIEHVES